jgi:predicted GNAT family N-acyltransferase
MTAPAPLIRPITGDAEFALALEVRRAVFVREQGGPLEEEPDPWDSVAEHFVVEWEGDIVGAARLYQPEPGILKIGRVCLLPAFRGRGWGALLMEALLRHAVARGPREVVLDAQTYALPFYERLGFTAVGEEFLDAGIPHRRMVLSR